jgi:hypothetical protein
MARTSCDKIKSPSFQFEGREADVLLRHLTSRREAMKGIYKRAVTIAVTLNLSIEAGTIYLSF